MIERTRDPAKRAAREAELQCPPLPDELTYLWRLFQRLHARRGAGFALEPIAFSEIEAFLRLSGSHLAPFELRLIEDLDDLFRKVQATQPDD